jgi:hypothetical protein
MTLAAVVLAGAFMASPADIPFSAPSPGMLREIQTRHSRKDWWFVTTDSARHLARIRTVDAGGLSGLSPRKASVVVPERIAWSSISRIDERHSKFLSKRIQGVLYGAIAGLSMPFLVDQTNGADYLAISLPAGVVVGGWLGGLYGDGIVREEPIYVSPKLVAPTPPPAPAPGGIPDSISSPGPTAAAIAEACGRIHPSDRLRIHADFGTFDGQVEHAGADGLSGLRPYSTQGAMETIPGIVAWDRIRQIDRGGSGAAVGARRGAIALGAVGAVGGLFAIAVSSAAGSGSTDPSGSWILIGAAAGAAGGALIGAAIGSGGTSWTRIYGH